MFDEREAGDADAASLLFDDDADGDTAYDNANDHAYDTAYEGAHNNAYDHAYEPGAVNGSDQYARPRRHATTTLLQAPPRRSLRRELRRKRRHRRVLLLLVVVLLAGVAGAGWYAYRSLYTPKDWVGNGTSETVLVKVNPGDGSSAIGSTMVADGVVRSAAAFVSAAAKNSHAADVGPGVYQLRKHMSAVAAVNLLLDPSAHIVDKVTIPEGTSEKDIIAKLAAALKVPVSQVAAAAADVSNLGLPDGYGPSKGALTSAEGFLYPDTYSLDPGTPPAVALQQMAAEFTTEDKALGFADGAKKLGLSPYQSLIIASMEQAEVKFASDAPKVARVILNRLATNTPLKVDPTSIYGAIVQGLDPSKVNYATLNSPYNTYLHVGLPPTPIGNPGEAMLQAAIAPAAGDWLYYVNGDAQGHLYFTDNMNDFEAAVARCTANHWGCGG
jgi:UPF0755 protein